VKSTLIVTPHVRLPNLIFFIGCFQFNSIDTEQIAQQLLSRITSLPCYFDFGSDHDLDHEFDPDRGLGPNPDPDRDRDSDPDPDRDRESDPDHDHGPDHDPDPDHNFQCSFLVLTISFGP